MNIDKSRWQRVKFGDVVQLNTDRCADPVAAGIERYVGLEHIDPEDLRIRRWGLVEDGTTFSNRFKRGHVLFGKRRAYQRKVAVADFEGICSSDIYVFEPKNDRLLPELLPFLCQTEAFLAHAVETSAGSLSPRTNWEQLARFEFMLPPIEDQLRITRTYLICAATIDALMALHTASYQLWRSAATAHLTNDDTQQAGFEVVELGDAVARISDGPFGSRLKTEHYSPHGVRVIRLQNIGLRDFDDTDKAFISYSYYQQELTGYTVYPGDVIMAGLGDEHIPPGRSCVVPPHLGVAINKAHCYCIRPNRELLNAEYLISFLNSSTGLRQAAAYKQGTTQLHLNITNIRRMKIPLPPLDVQEGIVNLLNGIRQAEAEANTRYLGTKEVTSQLFNVLVI